MLQRLVGRGEDDGHGGVVGVCYPGLGAVDGVGVAVINGGCGGGAGVAAVSGLQLGVGWGEGGGG